MFLLFSMFFVCYLGPILIYPVNDIRFLFPLMIVLLHVSFRGWNSLVETYPVLQSTLPKRIALGTLMLCMIPNIVWISNVVKNNVKYLVSPRTFYDKIEKAERYPEQFGKPLSLAAEWAAQHCDSTEWVASRWKEAAFWLNGRPAVEIDPQTSMDYTLRDFRVKYIVSVMSRIGIDEFESAMAKSTLFDFTPVHHEGTVEVVEVTNKNKIQRPFAVLNVSSTKDSIRREFRRGFEMLESGVVVEAESLFQRLSEKFGKQAELIFHVGVAKEFAGHLDEADEVFKSFRLLPQAGTYVVQAWYHQEIISRLRAAESVRSPAEKAERLNAVAINYRELAFRHRGLVLLRRSLDADSSFFPSLILYALYSFEDGDLAAAKKFLARSKYIDESNVLVQNLGLLMQYSDSLRNERAARRRVVLRSSIAGAYEAMGLREEAIGELLQVLEDDPSNQNALKKLMELYDAKRRYTPALRAAERILTLNPSDEEVKKKRDELISRW